MTRQRIGYPVHATGALIPLVRFMCILLVAAFLQGQIADPQSTLTAATAAIKSGTVQAGVRQLEDLVRRPVPVKIQGQARLELVRVYQVNGQYWDAIRHLRELRKLAPRDAELAYQLGMAYRNLSKWAFEQMKAANPVSARVQQILGAEYAVSGAPAKAISAFKKAIEAEPSLPGSHLGLASLYAQSGRRKEALAEVDRELEVSPESAAARALRQALVGITE